MAKAISNNTQVFNYGVADLTSFTPIYGIYENSTPVRVVVFSYLDDPSGANTVHAAISIAGATMPSSVKVKYLAGDERGAEERVHVGGADFQRDLRVGRMADGAGGRQDGAVRHDALSRLNLDTLFNPYSRVGCCREL
ncbi:hypothetical protein B0H14DRAFT_3170856 [Mycena olivaceomarginata]|nr:hypothetical protein B0H14DRAFT_3170856 [Mycena olivaceomarginata]